MHPLGFASTLDTIILYHCILHYVSTAMLLLLVHEKHSSYFTEGRLGLVLTANLSKANLVSLLNMQSLPDNNILM